MRTYKCNKCGETALDKFYTYRPHRCKLCLRVRAKPRTYRCNKCSETKTNKFYSYVSYRCKACIRIEHQKYKSKPHIREKYRQWARQHYADPEARKHRNTQMARYWRTPIGAHSHWRSRIKYSYGLTEEKYNIIYTKQKGACAGCGIIFKKLCKPHIDHCHKTNKVRGLLCRKCNLAVGHVDENVPTLLALAKYLKKHAINNN